MTSEERINASFCTLIAVIAAAISSCSRSEEKSQSAKSSNLHSITIGLREDGKFVSEYEGTGMAMEVEWTATSRKNFELSFKGMHLPQGASFVSGNTNYQDSTVRGSASIEGDDKDRLACNFKLNSKVPVHIQFIGIADFATSQTNESDASFTFEAGNHELIFLGKIISIFEGQKK